MVSNFTVKDFFEKCYWEGSYADGLLYGLKAEEISDLPEEWRQDFISHCNNIIIGLQFLDDFAQEYYLGKYGEYEEET